MAACGAGYDYGIHCMMTMVYTLLVESFLKIQRHIRYEMSVSARSSELACAGDPVQSFEAWKHNTIPCIADAPLTFQPVCYGAITCYDILGRCLTLVFLTHHI